MNTGYLYRYAIISFNDGVDCLSLEFSNFILTSIWNVSVQK